MATEEDLTIRLGLTGQRQTSEGLRDVADDEKKIGDQARKTTADVGRMGATLNTVGSTATKNLGAGVAFLGRQTKYGALGLAALGAAGAKWGLGFNAQVESARLRFKLFTGDVNGLTSAVQRIDASSQFNFGGLADAAAMLGNSGVRDIPQVLQAAANAAAASGKGEQALQGIVIALSQIQAKGRLSQEEINQLNEAGAPGAQQAIQKAFGLTADQVGNLGGQGLDASKAIDVLTKQWTSGRMAKAAQDQISTLGGQWQLLTGNAQKASGALTRGLAHGLETDVLPAANRALTGITAIFGDKGLSNEEKLRRARNVIRRELGPVAQDIIKGVQDADLAGKLDSAFEDAMDKIASTAADKADDVVLGFVNAWLDAGPWAKLASGAWLAHKLGLDNGALQLLKGLGSGGGKNGGMGGLGKAGVVPVFVTNWGGGAPGAGPWVGMPKTPPTKPTARGRIGRLAQRLGPVASFAAGPEVGLGVLGYGAYLGLGHDLGITTRKGFNGPPVPANIPNAHLANQQLIDAGVFSPGTTFVKPTETHVTVNIDGRPAAKAVARSNAKQRARK